MIFVYKYNLLDTGLKAIHSCLNIRVCNTLTIVRYLSYEAIMQIAKGMFIIIQDKCAM